MYRTYLPMATAVERIGASERAEPRPAFPTHRFIPLKDSLMGDRKRWLMEIEKECFGGGAYLRKGLSQIQDPRNTAILLGNSKGMMIGYAYASPGLDETAHVGAVAILPEYQNEQSIGSLMGGLEKALLEDCIDNFMEGSFPVETGQADLIQTFFGRRVLEKRELFIEEEPKPALRTQRFLKIELNASNVIPFPTAA